MEKTSGDVAEIVTRLAGHFVATQRLFDRAHLEATAAYLNDLHLSGLSAYTPLARALLPALVKLDRQTLDVQLALTSSKEVSAGLDVVIAGRVLTTFDAVVYGAQETRYERLKLDIEAIPLSNPDHY